MKPRILVLTLLTILCAVELSGCQKQEDIQFGSVDAICELATLECYYHNTAVYRAHGGFLGIGYKKAWLPYDGIVKIGIDASKIRPSQPDPNGVVSISMPKAKILSIQVIEDSIEEAITETGIFTSLTAEDKTYAISQGQVKMRQLAESNVMLLNQGEQRARRILEEYIKSVGNQHGKKLTVQWVDEN